MKEEIPVCKIQERSFKGDKYLCRAGVSL